MNSHRSRREWRIPHSRLWGSVAAVAVLAGGTTAATVTHWEQTSATMSCSASYTVYTDWGEGFEVGVKVTNTGTAGTNGWTLSWAFSGNQHVTEGWGGTWTQSAENIKVASADYDGELDPGETAQIGALFTYSGTNAAPTAISCTPAGAATTEPTATTSTTASAPVATASSSASAPANATAAPSASASASAGSPSGSTSGAAPQLHVSGNQLVNASGAAVVLHGVDRAGTEYQCVHGVGIFDGPNDQASITAIKSWGPVNAVRVPLNEACWNGESYVNSAYSGANYINAIKAYVSLLNANGIVAILDLHWTDGAYTGNSSACSSAQATCQKPMPDAAEAVPFWKSVATTFKGNDAVVFDLFNEPFASRATGSTTSGWTCWENGGTCPGISYQVAGMQTLVNTVRATGASNVIMLGGEEYSNDLSDWLQYEPTDPDHNLVASWHSYNFNACSTQSCWTSQVAPVIAKVPLVAGEIGENDCAGTYINGLASWLESEKASFLAWTWDAWPGQCASGPALITDYTGTPTAFGAAYEAILKALG